MQLSACFTVLRWGVNIYNAFRVRVSYLTAVQTHNFRHFVVQNIFY